MSTPHEDTPSYAAELAETIAPERLARSQAFSAKLIAAHIERNALGVGASAPDFSLPDTHGKQVQLYDLLERGPVVLAFYRGAWCPYCNLQLRTYQKALPQITAHGATLVAVSPQLPDGSLTMTEQNDLTFPVLSDVGNRVARQYGLVFAVDDETRAKYLAMQIDLERSNGDARWELPMPGTFVIDRSGVIRLAFVTPDYTQRVEPAEIVAALATANREPRTAN
jgi:peroxiredoxin